MPVSRFMLYLIVALHFFAQPCAGTKSAVGADLQAVYAAKIPRQWGERLPGVKVSLDTQEKVMALTFDACGGSRGSGYDAELIAFLKKENIPATLFVSGRWIDANPLIFARLAREPLFTIENHGLTHRPCSVNGRSAYGVSGTKNGGEAFNEIDLNARKIEEITGRRPKLYRPGTAFLDEVCLEIAQNLAHEVANYNVLGDAGATWSRDRVKKALLTAPPGSIVLLHMNHPGGQTAAGLRAAYPELRRRGWRFVRLADYKPELHQQQEIRQYFR